MKINYDATSELLMLGFVLGENNVEGKNVEDIAKFLSDEVWMSEVDVNARNMWR